MGENIKRKSASGVREKIKGRKMKRYQRKIKGKQDKNFCSRRKQNEPQLESNMTSEREDDFIRLILSRVTEIVHRS